MTRAWYLPLSMLLLAGACSNPAEPDPIPTDTQREDTFTGIVDPGGTQFYQFSVQTNGRTQLTLQSLRPAETPVPALTTPVRVSLGTPADGACGGQIAAATVAPALLPHIEVTTAPGSYCAAVSDSGSLTGSAAFLVRIVHP